MECSKCGITVDESLSYCPKCDNPLYNGYVDELYIEDVAHKGEDWELAREKIDNALDIAFRQNYKGIKIIHGRASGVGHTRIIADKSIKYLKVLARQYDGKLVQDKQTDGAHILYF
jgi:hypothetical protein